MANDVTVHNGAVGTGTSFTAETYDTGSGHRQVVTVGAAGTKTFAAAPCNTSADELVAANATRLSVTIQNVGTVPAYLGKDNTVTTSTGLYLAAGASLDDTASRDAWWGITASGTADLRVCEVS